MISGRACKVFGAVLVIAGALFCFQEARLLGEDKLGPKTTSRTFRLNDGTELPIEEWPETYEAVEWQPPIDEKKAKVIVEYDDLGWHIWSIAVDPTRKKVYWLLTVGPQYGRICRANYDGSAPETVIDDLAGPWGLCVVPSIDRIYWVASSNDPEKPGRSVFQSTLNGSDRRAIVTGLKTCTHIQVDAEQKKIYWEDSGTIWTGDLSGVETGFLEARPFLPFAFAVDSRNGILYAAGKGDMLVRQRLDGTHAEPIARQTVSPPMQMVLDSGSEILYWYGAGGLLRTRLNSTLTTEQLVKGDIGSKGWFAVDFDRKQLFWATRNDKRLMSATLPPPWQTIEKPAPPLITSMQPTQATPGETVTLRGKGLASAKEVLFLGKPANECVTAAFKLNGESIDVVVPRLDGAKHAVIAVIAAGGATATVPRDTQVVKSSMEYNRRNRDVSSVHYVRANKVVFQNVEHSAVFVEDRSFAGVGSRGGCLVFVKNGGMVGRADSSSIVIFEPQAYLPMASAAREIPVGAIRPSFLESALMINSKAED